MMAMTVGIRLLRWGAALALVGFGFVACTSDPSTGASPGTLNPAPSSAPETPKGASARAGSPSPSGASATSATPQAPSASDGQARGGAVNPVSAREARVSARGYGRVDLSLPRLRHEGGAWQLNGDPVPLASAKGEVVKQVVLEGKMILDDSLPRRRVFWVAPHYDGCVDKHERVHRPHWVRVSLPEGRSVQVTDQPLYLQGVARRVGADELVFDAKVVQIQASVVPSRGAR